MAEKVSSRGVSTITVGGMTKPSQSGAVYKLTHVLGEGRYGTVFKGYNAADTDDGLELPDVEYFAIKLLKGNETEIAAQMLRHEVAMNTRLKSRYLADVEDYSIDPEQHYLVMEYVPETLFGLFCRNVINQNVLMNLIRQAPDLLEDLLKANVVHVDLKPNNIGYLGEVIGEEMDLEDYESGDIVALDYGLAMLLPPNGCGIMRHNGTAETLPYSAPEFVQAGEVNKTTDTYGIARTLEWLLTGVLSQSPAEFTENVISYHRKRPPQSLIDMYAAMTASDPANRPSPEQLKSIAAQVVAELEQRTVLGNESVLFSAKSIQKSLAPAGGGRYEREWYSVDEPTSLELRALERISEEVSGGMELDSLGL